MKRNDGGATPEKQGDQVKNLLIKRKLEGVDITYECSNKEREYGHSHYWRCNINEPVGYDGCDTKEYDVVH